MLRLPQFLMTLLIAGLTFPVMSEAQEQTLLGRIGKWQYPGSTIDGATMSDAATVNEKGERTVPSIQCKTVMATPDPIEKVVAFYKSKLQTSADSSDSDSKDEPVAASGRSVTFHDDAEGRPVAIHIILVNSDKVSTTLVISRAKSETDTHIAWSQYSRL